MAEYKGLTIEHMGHATIMVRDGAVVYTDPYMLSADPPKADLILVSHDHFDHLDTEKIDAVRKSDTEILIFGEGAKKIQGARRVKKEETVSLCSTHTLLLLSTITPCTPLSPCTPPSHALRACI